jgi:hypothetical protein
MATGDYCTIGELKARLWPTGSTPDNLDDNNLHDVITSVSRMIDEYTGTRFYTTAADETRYYSTKDSHSVWIDQAISVTSLATDDEADRTYSTVWTASDYELWPYNASALRHPYCRIDKMPLGNYSFPSTLKGVKVVGKFGYDSSTAPENTLEIIKDQCLIQCVLDFKLKDTPFGVMGAAENGQVIFTPGLHPSVRRVLNQFKVNMT